MQNALVDNKQNMTHFRAERKDYPNPVQFHHKTHFVIAKEKHLVFPLCIFLDQTVRLNTLKTVEGEIKSNI